MKKKLIYGVIVLIGIVFVSGCSFNVAKWNPFKKTATVAQKTIVEEKNVVKSREQLTKEIDAMTNQMVEKINAGNWQDAITVGEAAYSMITGPSAAAAVKGSVYGLDAEKEKLVETLAEAYDFKSHLEGLNNEEKQRYVRTARVHFNINPSEPFKKLALAKVLVDTGDYKEGLRLATELYNSKERNKDVTENYAWVLYLAGRKAEAYNIYKSFYAQSETLVQLYHSAIVIEEQDKLLGLVLYKGCEKAGNNLMVIEPNVKNLSAQTYINNVITGSQKAYNRLLAGGMRIDSQYNLGAIDAIIKSIVQLAKK